MTRGKEYSISELAEMLGVSPSTVRSLGKNAAMNQILAQKHGIGDTVLRCDADAHDSSQWGGDAKADLDYFNKQKGKRS